MFRFRLGKSFGKDTNLKLQAGLPLSVYACVFRIAMGFFTTTIMKPVQCRSCHVSMSVGFIKESPTQRNAKKASMNYDHPPAVTTILSSDLSYLYSIESPLKLRLHVYNCYKFRVPEEDCIQKQWLVYLQNESSGGSNNLMFASIPILESEKCRNYGDHFVEDKMVCAGVFEIKFNLSW
jgi:hypothetical protein